MPSWPPQPSSAFLVAGKTTIRWGTEGLLQTKPAVGFYTVTRFGQNQLAEQNKLTQGLGLTSTVVTLIDGVQWNITVRDDTQMTPPNVGTTLTIVDAGGMVPGGSVGQTYSARVVNNSYDIAPKQPGERVLVCENLILVDSQVAGAQV